MNIGTATIEVQFKNPLLAKVYAEGFDEAAEQAFDCCGCSIHLDDDDDNPYGPVTA